MKRILSKVFIFPQFDDAGSCSPKDQNETIRGKSVLVASKQLVGDAKFDDREFYAFT